MADERNEMQEQAGQDAAVPGQDGLVFRAMLVREVQEATRTVPVVMSTGSIDSHGEIVEQIWRLERFLSNPVFLWAHNSREMPLGTVEDVKKEGDNLVGVVRFAGADVNPMAEQVFQAYRQKVMRGVSVGFLPHEIRMERRDDKDVVVLSDNELFELSAAPLPANAEALSRMHLRSMAMARKTPAGEAPQPNTPPPREKETEVDMKELEAANRAALDENALLKQRIDALDAARAEQQKRAEAAEAALVHHEVSGLVGKKITPKEAENLVKFAAQNRELYLEYLGAVKERPDMGLVKDVPAPTMGATPPVVTAAEDISTRAAARQ